MFLFKVVVYKGDVRLDPYLAVLAPGAKNILAPKKGLNSKKTGLEVFDKKCTD